MVTNIHRQLWIASLIITTLFLLSTNSAFAQGLDKSLTSHAFYGQMVIPNNDPSLEGGDFDVNIFGLDVQKSYSGKSFDYGLEGGGLLSLDSSLRSFHISSGSGGGSTSVSIDINSFLIDVFFGGYVGYQPAKWLRLWAGGGPLIVWASRESDPVEAVPFDESTSESESEFGGGVYARVGIDIFFTDTVGLNLGARITETTLSFENQVGKVDVEGYQYYIGLAFRY
jgi:hypothetical protein